MSAFTLTELLVVISLIVLILALAVPAFNLISGSGSIDQAQNQISAMLSQAQATAVARENYVGVLFYRDAGTDRTGMALVEKVEPETWTSTLPGGGPMQYRVGDVVSRVTALNTVPATMAGEPTGVMPRYYMAINSHTGGPGPNGAGGGDWMLVKPFTLDLVRDKGMPGEPPRLRERVLLPKNVAVQFPLEPQQWSVGSKYYRNQRVLSAGTTYSAAAEHIAVAVPSPGNRPPNGGFWTPDPMLERYMHLGVVMFDPSGKPVTDNRGGYSFAEDSELAILLPEPDAAGFPFMYSRIDFVIFDQEAFRGAGFDDNDPMISGQGTTADETAEEVWLDENAMLMLVHRYSGTLGRAE